MFLGRAAELAALERFAGVPSVLVVRGPRGIGKTAFLHELRRLWEDRGITVLSPSFSVSPGWDVFGTQAVVRLVRESCNEFDGADLAGPLAALGRMTCGSPDGAFAELVRLFARLRATRPVAVFVDDVDTAADPVRAVAAARRAGCTVVVTCCSDTPLVSLADLVLDLPALVADLLAPVAPLPLDSSVLPAVRTALGPLAGNPGTVLATFGALLRSNAFTDVLGHLCLRDPSAIALPADHSLVLEVTGLGETAVRIVVLAARTGLGVDDVLDASGHDGGEVVDRLVAIGALACDDNGQLSVPCPALAAALTRGADYRVMARQLLRPDLIALAGAALPPDPALASLLEREATRILRADPPLAAQWFRAALRHAPVVDRVRLLRTVLQLLVRTAQYSELAEVVSTEVALGVPRCCRHELAVAAALASVHTGQPLPANVFEALSGDTCSALQFAVRWFDSPVSPASVAAAFGVAESFDAVDGPYDVVAMLRQVPGYGVPETGPIATYRQLLRDYAAGEWSQVVTHARRLELSGAPTAMHHVARLLTAEVHASTGDLRRAAQWLALTGPRPFPALWAWADLGVTRCAGRGWAGYAQAAERGEGIGLACLLLRLGLLEEARGNADGLARAAAEAKRWCGHFGSADLRTAEMLLRGLSERDSALLVAAVALLRRTGNAADLMRACLAVAALSDDPAPWYGEALEFARKLGASGMDLHIKETMRKVGLTLPRARAARDNFSAVELRIIALVGQGRTNRQIATTVRMSEKTVENYLTRLFVRTGCRSRLDLATASLEGRLVAVGAAAVHG